MASKFRLNRYNWLGQKLLAQHDYGEILRLRQYLVSPDEQENRRPTSDHLSYIHGLALMKTSTHLDEIIFALQRLNFDKNSQHFLLLCHCLLYSGNYDSVVALFKQVINKEIDTIASAGADEVQPDELLMDFGENVKPEQRKLGLDMVAQESFEFKRIFDNINRSNLINEPLLWFTFGLCLEYQRQFKDAYFAFRVAAKLASGAISGQPKLPGPVDNDKSISNFYAPQVKFAEYCIKHKGDFKSAIQVLAHGSQLHQQNYELNPLLALCISVQPTSNQGNFNSAIEIVNSLEAHSISNRNPSSGYNRLAIKCKSKLDSNAYFNETGDEDRCNLNYLLVKSHVIINSSVQELGFAIRKQDEATNYRIEKLIESLKNSDPRCRISASLWSNLGLCYLIKKRFVACFSCLSKAHQISPLDWRVNYNLAAACIHVGLFSRAMLYLLAAKRGSRNNHPLITTLLAVCYEKFGEIDESRRLHIGSIGPNKGITSLINYLIFLHRNSTLIDEQHLKIKLHLLDQLEHCWLQRNQGDPQFNDHVIEIAQMIADQTNRKSYAWTKAIPISEIR